jgi:hypothetical protein
MLGLGNTLASNTVLTGISSPLELNNCILWLDFSDETKMFTEVGQTSGTSVVDGVLVGTVVNKATASDRLNNFVKSTSASYRPNYRSADGGYVEFGGGTNATWGSARMDSHHGSYPTWISQGGVNEDMSTAVIDQKNITVFFVIKLQDSDSTGGSMLDIWGAKTGDLAEATRLYFSVNGSGDAVAIQSWSSDSSDYFSGSTDLDTSKHIITYRNEGGGTDEAKVYIDGVLDGTGTFDPSWTMEFSNANGLGDLTIGARSNASGTVMGSPFKGDIYEIIFYNETLSDGNKELVEDYLNKKYSI